MAGSRQSKAPSKAMHRRDQQTRDAQTGERVTLIALGILLAVAILVAAGVVWGIVLPPRAHVLTVGSQDFTAADLEQRGFFLVAGNSQSTDDPATGAMNMIKHDETLLQAGAAEVGEITADDMTAGIKKGIGIPPDADAKTFDVAYTEFLKNSKLDKATFERMARAQIISERLGAKFQTAAGDSGPQYHLTAVTSRDQTKLKQFRDAVAGGADFVSTALSMGLATAPQNVDFGWSLPPTSGALKDTIQVDKLQAGQMTEIIARDGGLQFDVYRMAERDEKRVYTEDQKKEVGGRLVDQWVIEQQKDKVKVAEDLSDGERRWVLKRVATAAQKLSEERAKGKAGAPVGGAGVPPVSATVVSGGAK